MAGQAADPTGSRALLRPTPRLLLTRREDIGLRQVFHSNGSQRDRRPTMRKPATVCPHPTNRRESGAWTTTKLVTSFA